MKYIRLIIFSIFIISSISVYSQSEKDTPRNGEGIFAFLRRNKRTGAENLNTFLELNKGKFGKGDSLLKDVSYILPDTDKDDTKKAKDEVFDSNQKGKKTENKLFGEKYAEYTIKSDKLKGACFFLSSGHGDRKSVV